MGHTCLLIKGSDKVVFNKYWCTTNTKVNNMKQIQKGKKILIMM